MSGYQDLNVTAVCTLRFLALLMRFHPFTEDGLNHRLKMEGHYTFAGTTLADIGPAVLLGWNRSGVRRAFGELSPPSRVRR